MRRLQFEYHLRAARQALGREAFEEAGERLAQCLRLDSRSGQAHFLAARTARRAGQLDFAEEELTTCDDLGWAVADVRAERAMLAIQQGEFNGPNEVSLRKALTEDDPDRFVALEALAQGYMRTYSLTQALACLDRWAEGRPDSPGARMRRGWVYERLDRIPEAEQDYRHLLDIRPDHPAAKLRLAQLLHQQRQSAEAAKLYADLDATSARDPVVRLGLAQCYVALGRKEEAHPLLDDLIRQDPDDSAALLEQGKIALGEGRPTEARTWLQRAAQKAPQAYEPHFQLCLCLQRLGEPAEAAVAEERYKAIEADLKRMSEATGALQRRSNDPALRFQIAEIFLRRGESAEGALWLESVVRLAPDYAKARQLLVELYERTGKPRLARTHRQALARLEGRPPR